MIEKNLVSVYIPTKNRLALATRAIASVLNQTYNNIEIIVVDDGSDLMSFKKLKDNFKDQKSVIFLRNQESLGACASRNRAIQLANGEFITGLDDDDYFSDKNRITYFVNTWLRVGHKVSGLFDNIIRIHANGVIKGNFKLDVTKNDLKHANFIGSQIFAPTATFVKAGFFDPEMPAWQDWDLWFRMADHNKIFLNINKCTYANDSSHGLGTISLKPQEKIRFAQKKLMEKMSPLSLYQKSSITVSLLMYRQVHLSFKDIMLLLLTFRLKSIIAILRIRL